MRLCLIRLIVFLSLCSLPAFMSTQDNEDALKFETKKGCIESQCFNLDIADTSKKECWD